jgi:indolepyruvate ferredoxin oxidoreductase beta subunit
MTAQIQQVTNVVVVGLGGQGVIRASDIIVDVMFHAGYDVKKAEIHGMSQRGGAVTSDVRFGQRVLSPLVPRGEADFVLALDRDLARRAHPLLAPQGRLVKPDDIDLAQLPNKRCLNVALLGRLSACLPPPPEMWEEAIRRAFRPHFHEINCHSFNLGRRARQVA